MTGEALRVIAPTTFTDLGLTERADIQRIVRAHISAITPNVKTMVLAEEFGNWVDAKRHIDLLCLDDEANLVVVEFKRDNSGHMELQALRYAAMVSTMRFDQAVEAHRSYLRKLGSDQDPEQAIRAFLDKDESEVVALSDKIRIVLASSDFSAEVTTTVLWLNKQGLDVRCVQMRPHRVDTRTLLDIDQLIPLPQDEQYQVALREKSQEQNAARKQERDTTRFDLTIGEQIETRLPKRRLIFLVIAEAVRQGVTIDQIRRLAPWKANMFRDAKGDLDSAGLEAATGATAERHYIATTDLFRCDGRTYALSNQWGEGTLELVDSIIQLLPNSERVVVSPSAMVDEEAFHDCIVRRYASGAVDVERNGIKLAKSMPVLREIAEKLKVEVKYASGTELNTRALGVAVMKAIKACR